MRTSSLFGFTLASDFPFVVRLPERRGVPELTFGVSPERLCLDVREQYSPIYTSPRRLRDGRSAGYLYQMPGCEVLSFSQTVDFYLWPDRIIAQSLIPEPTPLLEIHLLGTVLSYWLEQRGLVTLHASAVAAGSRAVAFVSTHGGGKSGLAASLLQAGHPLLSDDLVPIEQLDGKLLARPGYPQMRMWPDEANHLLGGCEHLPRAHPDLSKRRVPIGPGGFGTFHDAPLPLACLYLLERSPAGDAPIEIREVSPRDALIELLRHSFTPLLVEAAGLQPARFDLLSRLVLQVPVKRLLYPSGFDHLPRVAEAVRRDLDRC